MVTSYKEREALHFPRVSSDERMEREEECGEHVGGGEPAYVSPTLKDGDVTNRQVMCLACGRNPN